MATRPNVVPLERRVRDPGFTPAARDVDALVDLLADEDLARQVERAIERTGAPAVATLRRRFDGAKPPLRARVLRVLGRLAEHAEARAVVVAALADPDPKTRRNAAIALGRTRAEGSEESLLEAWERDPRIEMRRSLASALGKVGTARSLPLLRQAAGSTDAELARLADQARAMIERTESRSEPGRLAAERWPEEPVPVALSARAGLEEILAEELTGVSGVRGVRVAGRGEVRAELAAPLGALLAARTLLAIRFPLPPVRLDAGERLEDGVARALAGPEARRVVSTWTEGRARYRLAWSDGAHKRALVWTTARAVLDRAPWLANDPTASLWEVVVGAVGPTLEVALVPRALHDPRFGWRRRDVPAASHPTVAAALVRVAGVRADDVVWDPFVGAGTELVERALAGPYASLEGSDLEERALEAARENLRAAKVPAALTRADALAHAPEGVTLIVTNPPMGRRASRAAGLAEQLDRFLGHAAEVLAPGGRLVWLAPWPARARAAGTRAGLVLRFASEVDMGGFVAELQRWERPVARPAPPRRRRA